MKGGWFYGGIGNFKNLYIIGRGVLTPYFMKTPPPPTAPYCLTPFPNFVQTPTSLSPPTPTPTVFFLSCFFCWMGDHATFYLLTIWYLSTRRTLMCFMQQDVKFTELWYNVVIYWYSDFISHTQTNTNTHSTLRDQ